MKHTDTKCISSTYAISNGIVLFGEDKTSQKNIKNHKYAHEWRSKSND